MPNAYILSQVPTGYGPAISLIVEMLVQAGWVYRSSGDGLSGYSATGKIFTSTGSGAGGWGNIRAWARMATPDGREMCIQHNAAGAIRVKYSASATFVGGAPAANTVPSATDERVYWGAGNDTTPTFSTFFHAGTSTGNQKFHGMASATAPHGFWFSSVAQGGGAIGCGMLWDPVESVPEDPDPVVIHIGAAAAFGPNGLSVSGTQSVSSYPPPGTAQPGSWGHMDVARTQFLYVVATTFAAGTIGVGGVGLNATFLVSNGGLVANPFNGRHEALPILWMRHAAVTSLPTPGCKGWSKYMRWTTFPRQHGVDTLDDKKWICIGSVWLPWDGVTVPTN